MKKTDFNNLVLSVQQAGQIRSRKLKPGRVFKFNPVVVKEIRKKLDQSQSQFARMIGVSVATLQNWEQGRRYPVGPARALLIVAKMNPKAVLTALHQ